MNHGLSCGFRCGVPPRQTQTNNDDSGSPQRVAGRPPLLSVLITGSVPDGPERLWDGPYGIAVRRWERKRGHRLQKNTRPTAMCVGAAWKPFGPVRCRPTEGARRLPKRTAEAGGPLRYSTMAHSVLMVCFLITNNTPRPFLGLRCGVPPRQTHDCITTMRRPS